MLSVKMAIDQEANPCSRARFYKRQEVLLDGCKFFYNPACINLLSENVTENLQHSSLRILSAQTWRYGCFDHPSRVYRPAIPKPSLSQWQHRPQLTLVIRIGVCYTRFKIQSNDHALTSTGGLAQVV